MAKINAGIELSYKVKKADDVRYDVLLDLYLYAEHKGGKLTSGEIGQFAGDKYGLAIMPYIDKTISEEDGVEKVKKLQARCKHGKEN